MKKWTVGFVVFYICLLAQNICANPKYLEMFIEPPDKKHKVIGEIFHGEFVTNAYTMLEQDTINLIGQRLQIKARKLGANALIINRMERLLKVQKKKENYDIDPFGVINSLTLFIRIEATAIKIEKTK